jgi:pimeloyl-ACP methyl ester carboxylesterase
MKPALFHGSGPRKVIVMNGWLGCAPHWRPMLDALDADIAEVAVFDYRGCGTRRDVPGLYTFEEAAQDVLALADALGWPTFALVGHSMGGMAMQRVALAAPQRVQRMLGLAPVGAGGSRMDEGRVALFTSAVQDVAVRARIVDFSTGQRLTRAFCEGVARDSWECNGSDAMASYLKEWTGAGFSERVRGLDLPVKVVVGEHDPSITVESVGRSWQSDHPHAVIDVAANAGHYPMQEVPIATAALLQRWLTD